MNLFRIIFGHPRFRRFRRTRRRRALGHRDYLKYKEAARTLVHERLEYWRAQYESLIRKVAIRNQRTRWGSCSKNGNLNFNYRIVHLPAHLANYLIVHELCHLKEFNHSKEFWKLVAQGVPEYGKARRELKKISLK